MPARNIFHDVVVEALVADGWTVTADPFRLTAGSRKLYVDLAADHDALAADRGDQRIAVEVQSFLSDSDIDDLHHAVGQYVVYRAVLARSHSDRALYLAVPDEVYDGILDEEVGRAVVADARIRLFAFDPVTRRITRWTN